MSDEGFHEIQLNGKQLIFLCMTAALVLVVAFLSGVLVGRGVRSQKDANVIAEAAAAPAPAADPTPAGGAPAAQSTPPPPITAIAPPTPADEDLSYNTRLEGKVPPKETVTAQSAQPPAPAPGGAKAPGGKAQAANDAAKTAPAKDTAPPRPSAADAAKGRTAEVSLPAEPAGPGYYLKIVALRERGQADAEARRLSGKGYNAYIVPTSSRGPVLYSVRVGKFKTRKEAESIRRRLEKEEQLKPLIAH